MTFRRLFVACAALCLLFAASLGAWSGTASAQADTSESTPAETTSVIAGDGTPIPVEPDGGIGDGAGPLPTPNDDGLAYTGSDSLAIAFLGAGMIIVGATAMATAQSWRTR